MKRKCIDCFASSSVIDSRRQHGRIHRRRQCNKGGTRFTTDEIKRSELQDLQNAAGVPAKVKELIETLYKTVNGEI